MPYYRYYTTLILLCGLFGYGTNGVRLKNVSAADAVTFSTAEKPTLYGDGIHDDTAALQALLDEKTAYVKFPLPKVCYLISAPLRVHSGQELHLDRYCHIKLMPNSNCVMLVNADPENGNKNITVTGGIWDMNNLEQAKNPLHFDFPGNPADRGRLFCHYELASNPAPFDGNREALLDFHPDTYYRGVAVSFLNVENLRIARLTIKDPVTFSIMLNVVKHFTVEDITFDFNYGNPWAVNMDGVHLCGNCHFGVIRNIKGSCYDDMVAINADEGVPGPITDIQVDGLFADDCHSAVRLLSANQPVERISISNVYGTYYQYCIGITRYYAGTNGYFDGIVLKNIFASKAPRHSVYRKDGSFVYPFIWVQSGLTVRNISIENVYRKEKNMAVETIGIDKRATVKNMVLNNIVQENLLPEQFPLLWNKGVVENLSTTGLRAQGGEVLVNDGEIKTHVNVSRKEGGEND